MDIHKKSITACCITPDGKETQTFGTMTDDILKLAEWIKSKGCTQAAMESTGVYWKPIYNVMELEEIQTLVVNAAHIKAVPGRKTDVKDAEWIADLLRHGLLKGSYIPDKEQRELRELVRYRKSLVNERSREVNRLDKVLQGANIKLSSVVTDIMGVSGRAMLESLVDDVEDTKILAGLAKGRLKSKIEDLERALKGIIGNHQKLLISTQLNHIDFLTNQIEILNKEIGQRMLPFEEDLEILDSIPGIARRGAEEILTEIGNDMSRFPSASHLSSWAGMSPGNHESAGKRKLGKTTKGNKALRTALVEAANAASHTKDTYLSAKYHRLAARRGKNRAAVAVGHSILVSIYHLLKTRQMYKDLGVNYIDSSKKQIAIRRYLKTLESLGVNVQIVS